MITFKLRTLHNMNILVSCIFRLILMNLSFFCRQLAHKDKEILVQVTSQIKEDIFSVLRNGVINDHLL